MFITVYIIQRKYQLGKKKEWSIVIKIAHRLRSTLIDEITVYFARIIGTYNFYVSLPQQTDFLHELCPPVPLYQELNILSDVYDICVGIFCQKEKL